MHQALHDLVFFVPTSAALLSGFHTACFLSAPRIHHVPFHSPGLCKGSSCSQECCSSAWPFCAVTGLRFKITLIAQLGPVSLERTASPQCSRLPVVLGSDVTRWASCGLGPCLPGSPTVPRARRLWTEWTGTYPHFRELAASGPAALRPGPGPGLLGSGAARGPGLAWGARSGRRRKGLTRGPHSRPSTAHDPHVTSRAEGSGAAAENPGATRPPRSPRAKGLRASGAWKPRPPTAVLGCASKASPTAQRTHPPTRRQAPTFLLIRKRGRCGSGSRRTCLPVRPRLPAAMVTRACSSAWDACAVARLRWLRRLRVGRDGA